MSLWLSFPLLQLSFPGGATRKPLHYSVTASSCTKYKQVQNALNICRQPQRFADQLLAFCYFKCLGPPWQRGNIFRIDDFWQCFTATYYGCAYTHNIYIYICTHMHIPIYMPICGHFWTAVSVDNSAICCIHFWFLRGSGISGSDFSH